MIFQYLTMKKWILLTTVILFFYSNTSGAGYLLDREKDYPVALTRGVKAWTESNYTLAYELLRPLSEQGNAVAQYIIGVMYFRGKTVTKDYKESVKFLNLSAMQGYARAQHKLGNIYTGNILGKPDFRKAVKWFRLAAVQGYTPSQYFLATLYEGGDGIKQNYVHAYMWFSLASEKNVLAKDERDRIAKKMTASQIIRAQKMARVCKEKKYRNCD